MHTTMLGKMGPPYAMMPSYMTAFQSSPVRICEEEGEPQVKREMNIKWKWEKSVTWKHVSSA